MNLISSSSSSSPSLSITASASASALATATLHDLNNTTTIQPIHYDEDEELAKITELDAILTSLTLSNPNSLDDTTECSFGQDVETKSANDQYDGNLPNYDKDGADHDDTQEIDHVFITSIMNTNSFIDNNGDSSIASESYFDADYFADNPFKMNEESSTRMHIIDDMIGKLKEEEKEFQRTVKKRLAALNDIDLPSLFTNMKDEIHQEINEEKQRDEFRLPQLIASYSSRPSTSDSRSATSSINLSSPSFIATMLRPSSSPGV